MRKKVLTLFMFSSLMFQLKAQTILNSGFEDSNPKNVTDVNFLNWQGDARVATELVPGGEKAAKLEVYTYNTQTCLAFGYVKGKYTCIQYQQGIANVAQTISQTVNQITNIPIELVGDYAFTSNDAAIVGGIIVKGNYNGQSFNDTLKLSTAATTESGKIKLKIKPKTAAPIGSLNSLNIQLSSCFNCEGNVTYLSTLIVDNIAFNNELDSTAKPTIVELTTKSRDINAAVITFKIESPKTTSSVIKYGTNSEALTSTISATNDSTAVITGLQASTTYYYLLETTNSNGTTLSEVKSFVTYAQTNLLAQYTFDSVFVDVNGNHPFAANNGITFVADRNGNPYKAININNTGSNATIPGLPYSNTPRAVTAWVKINTMSPYNYNMVYAYGTGGFGTANGASISATQLEHLGYNNNHIGLSVSQIDVWYHLTFTYDGTSSRIYKNGVLISTTTKSWGTVNNNDLFKLGTGVGNELWFNGAIDDLKIYDMAISDEQVKRLYETGSINLVDGIADSEVDLPNFVYPNPVKNILYTSLPVEIYTMAGTFVKAGNGNLDVSDLPSGLYVVKSAKGFTKLIKE